MKTPFQQSNSHSLSEKLIDKRGKLATFRKDVDPYEKAFKTILPDKLQSRPINHYSANETLSNLPHSSQVLKKTPRSFPWLAILMTAEFVFATLNCMFICYAYLYSTYAIDDYLKHIGYGLRPFCGFQSYCCIGIFFIFPLFMILSLWKRILNIAKYVFLFIGSLCILSGIITFSIVCLANIKIPCFDTLIFLFCTIWGVGFVVRCWCIRKYKSAFYSSSLYMSYKKGTHNFYSLLKILVLYETIYITLFFVIFSE